jgi:hypothetical protein
VNRSRPSRISLPTTNQLCWAPERAILCALDASLILAIRALKAEHPMLDDPDVPPDHEPMLSIAQSLLATARGLHELIIGYDDLADSLTRLDGVCPAPAGPSKAQGHGAPGMDPQPGSDPF